MTVEYTKEVTAGIVGRYVEAVEAGADYDERAVIVETIAGELETTVASVRSKLVSEKVYVAKVKASEKGDSTSKAEFVKALRAVTGMELKSIDKATKADVKAIFEFIVKASDVADAETVTETE